MNCPSCAAPCPDSAKFCPSCRYSLPKESRGSVSETAVYETCEIVCQNTFKKPGLLLGGAEVQFVAKAIGSSGAYNAKVSGPVPTDRTDWMLGIEFKPNYFIPHEDDEQVMRPFSQLVAALTADGWESTGRLGGNNPWYSHTFRRRVK